MWKISGGTVYDPLSGIDGQVRDIWIEGGRIVAAPADPSVTPEKVIDGAGLVVMPGGIDMHCHIVGPKVNSARKMRPEEKRRAEPVRRTAITHSGTMGSVPSTFATGYSYAGLGYTTAFDAAVPPISARHAHEEMEDTPCIDKGFYVLMGNNHYILKAIQENQPEKLRNFVSWLLGSAKGYAAKLVNPGGVEVWKSHQGGNVKTLDSLVDHYHVTPRQIIQQVARAVDELKLPHSVHIHCNNLGLPGNWTTTLETMKCLEGHRGHLTHIQFHSYGGGDEDENSFNSKVAPLAEYINEHNNLTVDVGQVMFGETTSMTGDGPLGYYLQNIYGTKWFSADTEMESGCGIAPIEYKNKSLVHGLQWAIGMEWFLMVSDPWRVVLSTDHPNGASFLAYPQIIRLLMDRTYRQDVLKTVNPKVVDRCRLADLDREYSLFEICIITRAGPARILGLANKGHLGPGADADITLYTPQDDKEAMFRLPRMVIKSGQIIVEQGEIRQNFLGKTLHVSPEFDQGLEQDIADWFERYYSIRFRNYPVGAEYLHDHEVVPCS
ncbi:MAG: formylmethanofuran dehydrogenase subunit A [Planctomycetia bacterium]|nr:formylmethanofuran dehydrogenase subunit A [Planctomycetia bacterium]